MKDTNSFELFYTRVIGLINQFKYHGENIEDKRVVEKFLRILPPKFESLVMTLEENKDMLQFTIDELQASLINHEHRISRSNTSLEGAFATWSSIIRGRGRGRYKSRGRGRSFCRGGHNINPMDVTCRGQNRNSSQESAHRFDK